MKKTTCAQCRFFEPHDTPLLACGPGETSGCCKVESPIVYTTPSKWSEISWGASPVILSTTGQCGRWMPKEKSHD